MVNVLPTLEAKRMNLHTVLKGLMSNGRVYYQPDENVRLSYPCIIYDFNSLNTEYANNSTYFQMYQFSITLITTDATDSTFDTLNQLFNFDNKFISDDLTHFNFKTTI